MEIKRMYALILTLAITTVVVRARVFTRCQLTHELLRCRFPRTFISNWVCMIEQESNRNTSALVIKNQKKKFYGLFQIGSEYCKEGRKGGKCNITCEALLDEDIKEDSLCAIKVFEEEGFKYWSRWETRCKGQTLPDVEKCPQWHYPLTPPRD
ncbi:lysozyme-like [Battus philenor]|uniref:lysozyme-like n=1 Tax=Battus philenor TaxID=42288 RepID=UPI0035D0CC0F